VSKRKALTLLYVSYHFHYGRLNFLGVFTLLGGAMMWTYYISRSGTFFTRYAFHLCGCWRRISSSYVEGDEFLHIYRMLLVW